MCNCICSVIKLDDHKYSKSLNQNGILRQLFGNRFKKLEIEINKWVASITGCVFFLSGWLFSKDEYFYMLHTYTYACVYIYIYML